jgi:hypothetical protein
MQLQHKLTCGTIIFGILFLFSACSEDKNTETTQTIKAPELSTENNTQVISQSKPIYSESIPQHMDDVTEISKKALLGDSVASEKLANTFSVDQSQWMEIAMQNGSDKFYREYAMSLVGKSKYKCYRAIYFFEQSLKVKNTPAFLIDSTKNSLFTLRNQEKETGFKCGCDLTPAGEQFLCMHQDTVR